MKLRLHCNHQVILDFSFSLCLSLTHSPYYFQFISKSCWLYFQSVFKFTHFSSSPHTHLVLLCSPPAWMITAASPLVPHPNPNLSPIYSQRLCAPSSQDPLTAPISLRIKSKLPAMLYKPFEGWPSRSSHLISLFTPLSSTT